MPRLPRGAGVPAANAPDAPHRGSAAIARVGLLGGTFNPPHVGHLICAQQALEQLRLDIVLLVPAGSPPHKVVEGEPGPSVRLELCRIAVAGEERIGVSDVEVGRDGPSYTVDTLRMLHERDPGDELTFIVGADMAQSLATWREPREVLRLARLAVAERAGVGRQDIAERLSELAAQDRVVFFDMPRIDVSSTALRRRAAQGRSLRHWVPDAVAQAAKQHAHKVRRVCG